MPPPVERSTYVLAASAALALLIWQWRPLPAPVWTVENPAAWRALTALFWCGWAVTVLSTDLIDSYELFGLRQVYEAWHGRRPAAPSFKTRSLYKLVRHPIYFGSLLAFSATPRMSEGHLLFAVATTGYILIGIFLEERDLAAVRRYLSPLSARGAHAPAALAVPTPARRRGAAEPVLLPRHDCRNGEAAISGWHMSSAPRDRPGLYRR